MRSKLKRDQRARKVARYVKRCEKLTGEKYTGTGRWGHASYDALRWLYTRQVRAPWNDIRADQQERRVYKMFYNM